MNKKHILFVCKFNRFRSIFAEAFFKEYNKNKSIIVKSAAPIRGRPISDNIRKLANEYNLKIKKHPSGLTSKLLIWQNITVVVADDVPESLFSQNKEYGKKTILWRIPDSETDSLVDLKKTTEKIRKKVISLVKDYKNA